MKINGKQNKPLLAAAVATILIVIGCCLVIFFKLKADVTDFFSDIQPQEEVLQVDQSTLSRKLENHQPFAVLLIGTDLMRQDDMRGRADSIMVATVNPDQASVKILSIPRDTLILLPGTEEEIEDKINATYVYGYVPYLQETVEGLLDIPIDAYAILNYEGLIQLVDEVGGVQVDSNLAFDLKDDLSGEMQHIDEGPQVLDGRQALAYARMRKEDPQGDYGRQARQREIVISLIKELLSFDSFSNYTDILDVLGENIETNVTFSQAYTVFNDYRQAAHDVETTTIQAEASSRYFPHYGLEVFVFEPEFFPLLDIKQALAEHLGVEGMTNELNDNFDYFVQGFPFYSNHAVKELDLEEYVDPDDLFQTP